MDGRRKAGTVAFAAGAISILAGLVLLATGDTETADVPATGHASELSPSVTASSESSPSSPSPTPATPTPSDTPGTPVGEDAETFFTLWQDAIASSDIEFLVERLHPLVIETYGEPACRQYLATVVDPELEVRVLGVEDLDSYVLAVDDLDIEVGDPAVRVRLERRDAGGEPYETPATLASRPEGQLAWFTDCGEPL